MKRIRLKLSAYIVSIGCLVMTAGAFDIKTPKVATYVSPIVGSTAFAHKQDGLTQKFVHTKLLYGLTQDSLVAKKVKDNEPLLSLAERLDSEYKKHAFAGVATQSKTLKAHIGDDGDLFIVAGKQSPCA